MRVTTSFMVHLHGRDHERERAQQGAPADGLSSAPLRQAPRAWALAGSRDIEMDRETIYKTIREEILEQKKCQFQLFTASVAITSAVLAYAGTTRLGGLVFIAPMLLNSLALVLLIDKAISVQRKVGYLQLVEQNPDHLDWKWETDLVFRADPDSGKGAAESRKHTYVTTVCGMLFFLNVFCTLLYFFAPFREFPTNPSQGRALGWMDAACVVILVSGAAYAWFRRRSLVRGENSTSAILDKWRRVTGLYGMEITS